MATHEPKYKLYCADGQATKTFTESKPNLNAQEADFQNASQALTAGYGYGIVEATLQSETTVYVES